MTDILERLTPALAGRYTIERELGRGGMAVVYLARDEKHQRLVALKVMLPEEVGEDGAGRFRREISIAARLTHPNVLGVFDSGEVDQVFFYMMPYVEGESLRDAIVRERQMGILETASIVRQVADALDYAHSEGVVHRDIKPANIMLTRGRTRGGSGTGWRTPVVADFGIARAMAADDATRLTMTGRTVGTPTYMSPEQWTGGDSQVDGRTDQYSLGCVLYEMLIGEPPFSGSPMVMLARHAAEPVPSLRIVRPTIPEALEQVVYRAMAKIPADRFETMGEFGDALAAATEGPIVYSQTDHQVLAATSRSALRAAGHPSGSSIASRRLPTAGAATEKAPISQRGLRKRRRRRIIGATAAGVILLLAAGFLAWRNRAPGAAAQTKLMVLPFTNIGPVGDSTFADGLTTEVISRLSGVPRLRVVARTTAMKYKGTPKSAKEIGQELGVKRLVQGQVKWKPAVTGSTQATVSVQIVNVDDETEAQVKDFDAASLDDLYGIANAVAAKLDVTLDAGDRERLEDRPTESREAFEAYQKGDYYFNLNWEESSVKVAIDYFESAVRLDAKFALALAALGRAHGWMYQLGYDQTPPRLVYAKQMIDSALKFEPNLPEAQLALGLYYYWGQRDYKSALEQFAKVQSALPSSAETYQYTANIQRRQGLFRDAVRNYALSADLNPRDHMAVFPSAEALLYLRDYAESERLANRVIELAPEFIDGHVLKATLEVQRGEPAQARRTLAALEARLPPPRWRPLRHHWRVGLFRIVDDSLPSAERRIIAGSFGLDTAEYLLAKANMYRQFGKPARSQVYADSALDYMERTVSRRPDNPVVWGELAFAYAGLRQTDKAARAADRAVQLLPVARDALDGPEWVINAATVYSIMGDAAKATEWLDKALRIPSRLSPKWVQLDPIWDPVRSDARFQRLMREPPPLAIAQPR